MKKLFLLSLLVVSQIVVFGQNKITLQPDSVQGKDAWITSNANGNNYGNYPNFAAIAWTSGGEFISRGLIDFNLSTIPAGATITSAKLSLYCNTTSDHPQLHSNMSGSNACYLQRITSSWTEFGVNWANQPTTTTSNQVTLSESTSNTQDYTDIDVTALVADMKANSSSSFGIMIKLVTELKYRSLIFANSDHVNAAKRPKLEITYTTSSTPCIKIRPNGANGKDAWITSNAPSNNYGVYPNFAAIAWTSGGEFISRGLIDFNISSLPANATLTSARLNLYCNTTSDHPQLHSTMSGSNACVLQKITSTWDEATVNWGNQPTTTTSNQVTLNASTSTTQDYLNIDVLPLVADMRANPGSSFGMMIKLVTEVKYRSLIFANSDHADSTKWPSLEICYTLPNGLNQILSGNGQNFSFYPNPVKNGESIFIQNEDAAATELLLMDLQGKTLITRRIEKGHTSIELALGSIGYVAPGTYVLQIRNETGMQNKKILIQ